MGIRNKQGFTIIETMLFLAISGALTVALLVGAGASISQQRYRDSVNSLASFLQQQYSEVTSVRNDRSADWTCGSAGVQQPPSGGVSRGTTDCAVMGKYISLNDDKVTVRTVIGRAASPSDVDDIAALRASNLTLNQDAQSYPIEWGAKMQKIDKNPTATTIVVVRSPTTGAIRTFISESSANESFGTIIKPANLQTGTHICMDSDGMFSGKRFDVEFVANASSPTGIKVNGDGTTVC